MTFATKRAWRHARRQHARNRMRYRCSTPQIVHISLAETRDELIVRARRILDFAKFKRVQAPYRFSRFEQRSELTEVGTLRAAAMQRARQDSAGRAFYASARSGKRTALLYGPFETQMDALRALPLARRTALSVAHADAAFAAYGTCSIPIENARAGALNAYLPPLPAAIHAVAA